jgi:hypothetical protein
MKIQPNGDLWLQERRFTWGIDGALSPSALPCRTVDLANQPDRAQSVEVAIQEQQM